MTSPLFLFVHGWAGTPRLWDPVRVELCARGVAAGDMVTEVPPEVTKRPVIGIGHSLGAAWLLAHGPALAGFAAINGFTRFSAAPDFPVGTPTRVLSTMRRRLLSDPVAVLTDFHARAGLPLPADPPVADLLAQGLDLLGSIDVRQAFGVFASPHLALCGADDVIVPPAHSAACFADPVMVAGAGHGLPVTHPRLCADHILALVARC
ncbi:hypothetical protein CHU95_05060 [Niveispirillum lacus]|uniref:AB hydrolase-1 domain-containing protein n=1 Tax=Niveispirillum lacus TaxID=1981099 RepID=A0A255Z5H3_9PROT|nr:alpha/beta hydrolase [Niveispirillum lacus]OYQ36164.1 hypothetical protein CHU95_05060 [Niveispirillum lacus]